MRWTFKSDLSKSYFNRRWSRPKLVPFPFEGRNNGPSFLVYRSGWIAPRGLEGGTCVSDDSDLIELGISKGERHLLEPESWKRSENKFLTTRFLDMKITDIPWCLGEPGVAEEMEETMLERDPWLELWVRTSQLELLMSREAALRGEVDLRLLPLADSLTGFPLFPSGEKVRICGDDPRCSKFCNKKKHINRGLRDTKFLDNPDIWHTCFDIQLSKLPWDDMLGVRVNLLVLPG